LEVVCFNGKIVEVEYPKDPIAWSGFRHAGRGKTAFPVSRMKRRSLAKIRTSFRVSPGEEDAKAYPFITD